MDASLDCKVRTTLDECDKRWWPFCCDCLWFRATSWSFAICWFRLFKSSFIMYVSSCISAGRSLKSDFLFATGIKILHMNGIRRNILKRQFFILHLRFSQWWLIQRAVLCEVIQCNYIIYQYSGRMVYPRRQCSSVYFGLRRLCHLNGRLLMIILES